ncbi:MAG TPA: radical SAM protein, partial [Armatimonadota bacterium]|nr:radical SAM protein [Armatimonadota bacterium]
SREGFYDYARYREAASTVQLWIRSLSCGAFPGQFAPGGHALEPDGLFSLSSLADLTDPEVLGRVVGPLREYYREVLFPELARRQPRLVGINITYASQLPYALWLLRELRELLPESLLVCGGTEVSGVWKYLGDRGNMGRLFAGADACVVGEGETAFLRLLEAASAGRKPEPAPNTVLFDRATAECTPPPGIHYENLEELPTPDYTLMRSDLYFSPHTMVYYSPTRGCYWNKCTFCDYGLNFGTPTSPWRQRSVERTVEDLRAISRQTPYVYLSVDVLAPRSILAVAEGIAEAGIDVRWSAEIRLERYFDRERCEMLARSGCAAVSVGFESGSQRILNRIRKGTDLEQIRTTVRNFAAAGIAVQMMGFTGFPTETRDEAMASVAYLQECEEHWTVAGLGDFALTPGAILAQSPLEFGLFNVRPLRGEDIHRTLHYQEVPRPAKSPAERREVARAKQSLGRAEFDRPWAGGIDTAHSLFYYSEYGRSFPGQVLPAALQGGMPEGQALALNGVLLEEERFDLLAL